VIFEYWESVDGGEGSFFQNDTTQRVLCTTDVYDRPMVPLYSVRAETYNEAMAAHYECQGWAPYRPMEET
jgi:hypothetical protein